MYFTYILVSLKTDRYYVGSTSSLERRLEEHDRGKTTSTRHGGPWRLVYTQEFPSRLEAERYERYIKSQKSRSFIERLIKKKESADRSPEFRKP